MIMKAPEIQTPQITSNYSTTGNFTKARKRKKNDLFMTKDQEDAAIDWVIKQRKSRKSVTPLYDSIMTGIS